MSFDATKSENRIDRVRPDAPKLAHFGDSSVGVTTVDLIHRDQLDVAHLSEGEMPRYDRPLPVEIWYPCTSQSGQGCTYSTVLRDGVTPIELTGRASRDAKMAPGKYPLVLISHGFPGNRFLLSHFAENLASKGYVVASVDHADSTYPEDTSFESTRYNRPLDQRFVLDELTGQAQPIAEIIDPENIGVIGYSMGAYGALIFGGAGFADGGVKHDEPAFREVFERHRAGSALLQDLVDPRVKALVPIGPWGRQHDVWDAVGLSAVKKPTFVIGGSRDDISGYEDGIRKIFDELTSAKRYLLTFDYAGHNAAAPIPLPNEFWADGVDERAFSHYEDGVWDALRMNNIAQHFVTAFLGLYLKSDKSMEDYLSFDAADTEWPGFDDSPAIGLRLEYKAPG